MQGYFIAKNHPKMRYPYTGLCCVRAGVRPGRIYPDKASAERDARKLARFSRVGFTVLPYAPSKGK